MTEQIYKNTSHSVDDESRNANADGNQEVNLNVDPKPLTPEQKEEIRRRIRASKKIQF